MARKSGLEKFVGGLGVGALCFGLYVSGLFAHGWILLIGVFAGALPMISGLKLMASERANRDQLEAPLPQVHQPLGENPERVILRLAQANKGVVTPAQVSLNSGIDLETASKTLENMALKGHAEMRVKDNGLIDYLFVEFLE